MTMTMIVKMIINNFYCKTFVSVSESITDWYEYMCRLKCSTITITYTEQKV